MTERGRWLMRQAERADSERDTWATAVARHVQYATAHHVGLDDVPLQHALKKFLELDSRAALAWDMYALEVYGVFWRKVTNEIIDGRLPMLQAVAS